MVSFSGVLTKIFTFHERHVKMDTLIALILVFVLFAYDCEPYVGLSPLPKQTSSDKQIDCIMSIISYSPDLELVQTNYWRVTLQDPTPFTAFVLATNELVLLYDSEKEGNVYVLRRSYPGQGVVNGELKQWIMRQEGDPPFETHRIMFIIGFNKSMDLSKADLSTYIKIPIDVEDGWQVDQQFQSIKLNGYGTLVSLGFNVPGAEWVAEGHFTDCYRYDVIFFREPKLTWGYAAYLWALATISTLLVVISGGWARKLKPTFRAAVCMGLAPTILAFWALLAVLVPVRSTLVNVLFLLDLVISVVILLVNLDVMARHSPRDKHQSTSARVQGRT
jgi:hypothetical protein